MAANAYITVQGQINGLPTGAKSVLAGMTSATASGHTVNTVLASGDNTITVPTAPTTTGCIIVLPSTNSAITTLKGAAGDTGVAIGKTGFVVLSWQAGTAPTNFILNSAATQTGLTTEILFF